MASKYHEPLDIMMEVELRMRTLAAYCEGHGVTLAAFVSAYDPLKHTEPLGFAVYGPSTAIKGLVRDGARMLDDMTDKAAYDDTRWKCMWAGVPRDAYGEDDDDDFNNPAPPDPIKPPPLSKAKRINA